VTIPEGNLPQPATSVNGHADKKRHLGLYFVTARVLSPMVDAFRSSRYDFRREAGQGSIQEEIKGEEGLVVYDHERSGG
jgi:hypothetical protein